MAARPSTLHVVPADPDEPALVAKSRKGDREAFGALVSRHQKRAFAVAVTMLGSEAEAKDVVQEAFIRAWRALPKFLGKSKFNTWLHSIVVRTAIDALRKAAKLDSLDERLDDEAGGDAQLAELEQVAPETANFDPMRFAQSKEAQAVLKKGLAELSPVHRAVLVMREVEEMSYQEMAAALGIPVGTVMSRLFHARRQMQRHMLALGWQES